MSSRPPESTHVYHTNLVWTDGRGVLSADGYGPIDVAIPRDFGGLGDRWSPEELLVGATQSCMMATFTSIARRRGLALASCQSAASGTLGRVDRGIAFTGVEISLLIGVRNESDRALAASVAEQAHRACFVASSLKCPVALDYTIAVVDELGLRDTEAVPVGLRYP